ncbi:polypeptide N-acetylgalactosaminyltransferase 6 [Salpingoeca rosetta]|uniref:Polypeptide N-acetylgalactosaminyltransferase 6 n=1 Tax=Salpingoeca rosetta (strain ATCC 50818 / BSB-021) TaxID=946362 RepID=F2UNK0_SALR5|nr:polypeptide N-acetylgalactosaminyltransferase 6 [Salpingoeca rosetta]EGD79205.1 polypeptide N-acetylgalactosaminyltransferase 6 [Salpingoeca rosetta]|eukprot:XP_004989290.1 polypeptide N-acetylgalactosaminyltransferase 6 [Salpingoeca rosetta]
MRGARKRELVLLAVVVVVLLGLRTLNNNNNSSSSGSGSSTSTGTGTGDGGSGGNGVVPRGQGDDAPVLEDLRRMQAKQDMLAQQQKLEAENAEKERQLQERQWQAEAEAQLKRKQEEQQQQQQQQQGQQQQRAVAAAAGGGAWWQPVHLELDLPKNIRDDPILNSRESMYRQYGFNLKKSNELPLAHDVPDIRSDECKAITYPRGMPKSSVIIIYYNEPLSTLLRNVVSVLNRTPPELLGEILLIDDNSTLPELQLLPKHLKKLKVPDGMIKLFHRHVHDGIVGARVRGAQEASHPILVFLDSHSEVSPGWIEPLVARIHEDRTRVVVPNIRGIDLDKLDLFPGELWPPAKGSFNWRLTFTIVPANIDRDLVGDGHPHTRPIRSPVMPGGLFAIDKDLFFQLGAYDPEIKYYGAEHVELSFRVWQCGGSMEWIPCSNVGHIYREFNRFSVDPKLKSVNVGYYLDRNDIRVAEVWMDEYKKIFYDFRHLHGKEFGDVSSRRQVREANQCRSFKWYLDNVAYDVFVPDIDATPGQIASKDEAQCLSNNGVKDDGPVTLQSCAPHNDQQQWVVSPRGYIYLNHYPRVTLLCLRVDTIALVGRSDALTFERRGSRLHNKADPSSCLARTPDNRLHLQPCAAQSSDSASTVQTAALQAQVWEFKPAEHAPRRIAAAGVPPGTEVFVMSTGKSGTCLDNMQQQRGVPGLYGCHGGFTQQWVLDTEGHLASATMADAYIGLSLAVRQGACTPDQDDYMWIHKEKRFSPKLQPTHCLTRGKQDDVQILPCDEDSDAQSWSFVAAPKNY